jgi:hypothetical protein
VGTGEKVFGEGVFLSDEKLIDLLSMPPKNVPCLRWGFVYIYVFVCIYTYIYVCLCIYIHIYIYVFVYIYMFMYLKVDEHSYIPTWNYISMCICHIAFSSMPPKNVPCLRWECIYLYLYMYIYMCYVYIRICMYLNVNEHRYIPTCNHLLSYIYVYICHIDLSSVPPKSVPCLSWECMYIFTCVYSRIFGGWLTLICICIYSRILLEYIHILLVNTY